MNTDLIDQIKEAAKAFYPDVLAIRRDLHQHPELSFAEARTSGQVKRFLQEHQINFTDGWAGHGIVAHIKGIGEGPAIMLRADMDALPIREENDVPYKSQHEGVMHACGHDVHTSCLLGAAAILHDLRHKFLGEIKLIFQPGEEKLPGGASMMIKEGLFRDMKPKSIVAQHVFPSLPAGHAGFREGLYMASADEIYVTIRGKGGHGATPHLCIDPIVIASRVITSLQEIISRQMDPMSTAVLTIGKIYSDGGATNVIPDNVFLEGTLRAMDEVWRYRAHDLIRNCIDHICKSAGAQADVRIEIGYPSLSNDEILTATCRKAAVEYLGADKVHDLPRRMTSEDFAFYTQEIPGTFYRLGTGWEDASKNHPVHSSHFDINEIALETGTGLMAYLALTQLSPL